MTTATTRHGQCLCGAVRLTARAASSSTGACHCGMCRRWTGGPLLAVDCGTDVEFIGKDDVAVYASSDWAERGFCRVCGSHLFYRLKESGLYIVPTGLLDGDFVFDHQVFIEEKPGFYSFANETENLTGEELFAKYAPQG